MINGTAPLMMVIPPFMIPAEPSPAIARPPMKSDEELATAHIREPNSKNAKYTRKVYLLLKYVYNFPDISWREALAS